MAGVHATSATGAAASSPRRPYGFFPRRDGHESGRQGRPETTTAPPWTETAAPEDNLRAQRRPGALTITETRAKPAARGPRVPSRRTGKTIETPRRVIPFPLDASSSDKLHLRSPSQFSLVDRVLSLSSTTANALQAQKHFDGADQESAHITAVRCTSNSIDLREVERVHLMPFRTTVERTDTTEQLTRSVKRALADMFIMRDEKCVAGFETDT